jgi:hypothetical protein
VPSADLVIQTLKATLTPTENAINPDFGLGSFAVDEQLLYGAPAAGLKGNTEFKAVSRVNHADVQSGRLIPLILGAPSVDGDWTGYYLYSANGLCEAVSWQPSAWGADGCQSRQIGCHR